MFIFTYLRLCVLGCKRRISYHYRYNGKTFRANNVHHYPTDSSTCYVAFRYRRQYFHAVRACKRLGGKLATYDNYKLLSTNKDDLENYLKAFGNADCQWIGLEKKVWTWPALGMLS